MKIEQDQMFTFVKSKLKSVGEFLVVMLIMAPALITATSLGFYITYVMYYAIPYGYIPTDTIWTDHTGFPIIRGLLIGLGTCIGFIIGGTITGHIIDYFDRKGK